jgi:LemA protein
LQGELSATETKIAAARRFFNNAVAEFNAAIQSIPAVFFAASLGFRQAVFFELDEAERTATRNAPQVKF